jgi:hypothetical protein
MEPPKQSFVSPLSIPKNYGMNESKLLNVFENLSIVLAHSLV